MELELKPTPEQLDEIRRIREVIDGLTSPERIIKKRQEDTENRPEQIWILGGFVEKLTAVKTERPENQTGGSLKESQWVDILDDIDTGTTLQASVSSFWSSGATPIPLAAEISQANRINERRIYVRTVDRNGDRLIASTPIQVVDFTHYRMDRIISVRGVFGMISGTVSFSGVGGIDPKLIEQVQEIERRLLDPILESQSAEE